MHGLALSHGTLAPVNPASAHCRARKDVKPGASPYFGESPASLARTIDGTTYDFATAYDSLGRPFKTTYPTVNGGRFATRHSYTPFGYLKEIRTYLATDDGKPNSQLQGKVWWMADSYHVSGRIDGETYGNGLANDRVYSAATGRLRMSSIDKGRVAAAPYGIQQMVYTYDAVGNVVTRADQAVGRGESFAYDGLDRLTAHNIVTGVGGPVTVAYNQLGNITQKSDAGAYTYDATKRHALTGLSGGPLGAQSYSYDANGNMTSGGGRSMTWTSFNQARSITKGSYSSTFSFGASHERVKQVSHLETTIYVGGLFEQVTPVGAGAVTDYKHYIMAPTGRVAVYTDRSNLTRDTRYFHTDGLGSITAVTDEKGAIVKRFAFDAWGKRLDPATGATITAATAGSFTRGYTDHEMLADLGLVHMNGRIYDPTLGRFLSADPNVDGVEDAQGYNRYSYVGNNPMNATDPSGYFSLKDALKIVAIIVVAYFTAGLAVYALGASSGATLASSFLALTSSGGFSLTFAGAVAAGAGAGFGSAFVGSLLNGASLGDAFKAGVIGGIVGGITAGITHGIGTYAGKHDWNWFETALAHGTAQGGITEATGGEFRHGFYAGFFSSAAAGPISEKIGGGVPGQTVAAAIVGGTASAIGGGKFANGAVSGAFTYLLNKASHPASETKKTFDGLKKRMLAYARGEHSEAMTVSKAEWEAVLSYYSADVKRRNVYGMSDEIFDEYVKSADSLFYRISGTRVKTSHLRFDIDGVGKGFGGEINYFLQGMVWVARYNDLNVGALAGGAAIWYWNGLWQPFRKGEGFISNVKQIGPARDWAAKGATYYWEHP